MVQIRCVVERITYQSEETGYTVLKARVKDYADLVAVVGNLLDVNVGSVLLVFGEWKVDARYGRQFRADSWQETMPATVYGIEKYLGSGLVKGIGPKFAKRIVDRFGTDTIEIIDTAPERLLEVEGIGKKRIGQIRESWEQQREIKNVMLFLQDHGVSASYAAKIYKRYGNDSIQTVTENPFRLADDIWGIGFRTADQIAEKLGFLKTDALRCRSGIFYTLNKLAEDGHVYAQREQLTEKAVALLEADTDSIGAALVEMLDKQELVLDGEAIYLPSFYYAEVGVSSGLLRLLHASGIESENIPDEPDLTEIEQSVQMHYDEIQAQAISLAMKSRVMILTGGPGTGKTTTTQGIIAAFSHYGMQVCLAAPTGRAAKRMSEATGMEARTIHRLLEYKPPEGYQKNQNAPLEGDVLVVDECSMIDLMLMNALLKAIPSGMRLILVGDIDQLPSVGAGNVLRDIIESDAFPVVRLTRIFRQAQSSRIIMNAHRINEGKAPDLSNGRGTDFFFIQNDDPESAANEIVELVSRRLPKHYQLEPESIQVLTPMQRGVAGAANLNQLLQEALNPSEDGLRRSGVCFRSGDKVMQIRNNYDKDVFNGDIGKIVSLDFAERTLTVSFDGRELEYDATELDELVHAYATTIHKSQGSEYPVVVIPVLMSHYVMLQRNLIYTGITRAKKILVLIGSHKALNYAIRNVTVTARNSMLCQRLRGELPAAGEVPEEYIRTGDDISRILKRLSASAFRSRFALQEEDQDYIQRQGFDTIERHAREIIRKRLAPAEIPNDGRQTPTHGHPVFIAQHATATCCRSCFQKWYGVPTGCALTEAEENLAVDAIMEWIGRQVHMI